MIMIYQIFALAILIGIVYAIAYHRGRTIKERELSEMEYPELTKEEEEKLRKYYKFCKIFDEILTEDDNDDFFSGDISKSSRTDTNKDEKQK